MSMLRNTLRVATLCTIVCSAACGSDDDESESPSGLLDAGSGAAPSPDGGAADDPNRLYIVGANIQTTNESTFYAWTAKEFENVKFDLKQADELSGVSEVVPYNGYVYVPNSEKQTITRYEIKNDKLVPGPAVSFAGQGLMWLSYVDAILSPERAFVVNYDQWKIIEWNPTTMTITKLHDISGLKREGWGNEFRGGFLRDGKFIFYWTYTNARKDFLNNFVVGVWDTATGALTVEEDPTCPASAGFGGYVDEAGDIYMIADSFGLFTQFGGFKDPKPACIVRFKKGETKLDPTFKQHPSTALNGAFPWGFYYVGNGLAFTSAIDPAVPAKYNSVFETLFAPEHTGWLLDVKAGTAKKIEGLPRDGVGFESHRTDGRLFVPRTSGSVTIENIKSTESTLYEIKPDATVQKVITLPGYITVTRVR